MLMQPWPTTAGQAIARGQCVRYQNPLRKVHATAADASDASPFARVIEAEEAVKTAEKASRLFGATKAEIDLARKTTKELLHEEGIDI